MRADKIQQKREENKQKKSFPSPFPPSREESVSLSSIFFKDVPYWHLEKISMADNSWLVLHVESLQDSCPCPLCHVPSSKKQSTYYRHPQELPLGDYSCRLHLKVHRFYCQNPQCRRKIFCERFSVHLQAYQRCVDKVGEAILCTGLEAAGSKGVRILSKHHIRIKRNSVIRRVLSLPSPDVHAVENIGIDDWALRKGRKYGSIIVDNDTHKPLDLLPYRDSSRVGKALKKYTRLQTVSSDRADCFSKAIRESCPGVKEIADRWHLSHNLSEAVKRAFRRYYLQIKDRLRGCRVAKKPVPASRPPSRISRREQKYRLVKRLQNEGFTKTQIARQTAVAPITIKKYWQEDTLKSVERKKSSGIEAYDAYLKARFHQGKVHSSVALFKEIKEMGYTGSRETVNLYIRSWRPAKEARLEPPKWESLYYLCRKDPSKYNEWERSWVKVAYECEQIKELLSLQKEFDKALKSRNIQLLDKWLCRDTDISEVKQFIHGIRQDYSAVANAFREKWHNGITEGFVNKLKTIKRMCYGRANTELLKRMLACG